MGNKHTQKALKDKIMILTTWNSRELSCTSPKMYLYAWYTRCCSGKVVLHMRVYSCPPGQKSKILLQCAESGTVSIVRWGRGEERKLRDYMLSYFVLSACRGGAFNNNKPYISLSYRVLRSLCCVFWLLPSGNRLRFRVIAKCSECWATTGGMLFLSVSIIILLSV